MAALRLSRRSLFGAAGVAGGAVAAGAALTGCGDGSAATSTAAVSQVVPFYGAKQAGIVTPAQDRLAFAAFDLNGQATRDQLRTLLAAWAEATARMTAGLPVADNEVAPQVPPKDTGEALGLSAAHLTVTIGFGPSLFDHRFGLAGTRPAALADIPAMPGDDIDPTRSHGDLCVQACADDPQVAFHAVRNLRRIALSQGSASLRWFQLGFGRTSSTSTTQATPRNLMGFKDGTNNIKAEDTGTVEKYVWVGDDTDQPWMRGGSYVVIRRIRMLLEAWDRDYLADQENVIGRRKDTGAPLGTRNEFDTVPLTAKTGAGEPVIPTDAHIRLAAPDTNAGARLLRRGYSYTDGVDPDTGQLDAGLFFVAFQRDPRTAFVPVQRRLASNDALNEYIEHTSSGLYALPPGLSGPGDYWGKALLA